MIRRGGEVGLRGEVFVDCRGVEGRGHFYQEDFQRAMCSRVNPPVCKMYVKIFRKICAAKNF